MSKHTPAPWQFWFDKDLVGVAANGQPHQITRCEAFNNVYDLKLILAAPELLQALIDAVNLLEHEARPAWEQTHFRKIIAKATGGAE